MIQTDYQHIYDDLVKNLKEELYRNLTDEELAFLKWLAEESLK